MRSLAEVDQLVAAFVDAARLASVQVRGDQIGREFLPAPHRRPSRLPADVQAVYAFVFNDRCLKVGKAGPKTRARFTSQHYLPNSAISTLAKSILINRARLVDSVPLDSVDEIESLSEVSVGAWIERSTSRINLYLPVEFGAAPLSLLAEQIRKGRGTTALQEPFREYLMTVREGTDTASQRRAREKLLRDVLSGVFDDLDANRRFNAVQRRILWHASSRRRCSICRKPIARWEEVSVDHIEPYIRGGKTNLSNAALAHKGCNARKGARVRTRRKTGRKRRR